MPNRSEKTRKERKEAKRMEAEGRQAIREIYRDADRVFSEIATDFAR